MAFIFADLIVLPIVAAYRKYSGTAFALRITALMFVTMVIAALVIDVLFGGLGLIPGERPSTEDVFGTIELDYKAVLNALGLGIFAALFALTARRGGGESPRPGEPGRGLDTARRSRASRRAPAGLPEPSPRPPPRRDATGAAASGRGIRARRTTGRNP